MSITLHGLNWWLIMLKHIFLCFLNNELLIIRNIGFKCFVFLKLFCFKLLNVLFFQLVSSMLNFKDRCHVNVN